MRDGGGLRNVLDHALECSPTQRGYGCGGDFIALKASESSDRSGLAHGWENSWQDRPEVFLDSIPFLGIFPCRSKDCIFSSFPGSGRVEWLQLKLGGLQSLK